MQKVALVLGGLGIAAALGLGVPALMDHARQRAAWAAERAKQGTAAYDPRASDRHYRASRDAWQRSGPAGHLLGAGLLLFVLGAAGGRVRAASGAGDPSRPRIVASSCLDALAGAGLLALHWLDAGESAALRALAAAAPWLSALPFAPLIGGASMSMRRLGLRVRPGPRAVVAVALWPLAGLAPLGLLARPFAALHLRVAGLAPRLAEPAGEASAES